MVAPHLRWSPATPEALDMLSRQYGSDIRSFGMQVLTIWRASVVFAMLPMLFSAFAGWWIALRPSQRPALRVGTWLLLPASLILVALCGLWLYLTMAPSSVLDAHGGLRRSPKDLILSLMAIGPGLHYCLLGVLLVAVFAGRLAANKTSLPLRLPDKPSVVAGGDAWRRVQVLTWAMLGPQALAISAFSFGAFLVLRRLPDSVFAFGVLKVDSLIDLVVLIGIALVVASREAIKVVWYSIKQAKPNFAMLGLLLPVLLAIAATVVGYASNRGEWAAREFGQYAPPTFLPDGLRFDPWWLFLFLAAFGEEFVFREYCSRDSWSDMVRIAVFSC